MGWRRGLVAGEGGPCDDEFLDGFATDEVFLDDTLKHGRRTVAIPDAGGIDDGDRALLAYTQAVGFGAKHTAIASEFELGETVFQVIP